MRLSFSVAGWVLTIVLALSGCSGKTSTPGHHATVQAGSGYKTHAPLADTTNIVFVLPVTGVNGAAGLVLADALAASLRDAARPSVISGISNNQGPTLVGGMSEVRTRGTVAWVTANWELRAPYGDPVARISHEVVVDKLLWETGGVEAVNLIIAESEPHVIGMVADYVGPLTIVQEVAMPPVERIQMSNGASQSIEELGGEQSLIPNPNGTDRGADQEQSAEPPFAINEQTPTTTELRAAEAESMNPEPVVSLPRAPVRLVPSNEEAGEADLVGDLDELADSEVMEEPTLDAMLADSERSKPETDAKTLTDQLLEMADIAKHL